MQKQQLKSKSISDMFTPTLTGLFQEEIDIALKTLDYNKIKLVLDKYQIADFQDSVDFLEAIEPILNNWKKEGQKSIVVGEVMTSPSRCIACEIGRNVKIYEFVYKHSNAPTPMNQIHFIKDFGILLDIRKGILFEIRVCNAFLNKNEMKTLKGI